MLRRSRQKLGFTLVEILVVVMLVALLTTIGLVLWRGVDSRAFNNRVMFAMTSYRDAFTLYASQEKRYPTVPRAGNYCLPYGGLTGAEVNSRWSLGRPTNITGGGVTEASYFCRDFTMSGGYYAAYPPLSRAIDSIAKLKLPNENSDYLTSLSSSGIWVQYSGTAASSTLTILGFFAGGSCPAGTSHGWDDGSKAICYISIPKAYPTTYTGETWPYGA